MNFALWFLIVGYASVPMQSLGACERAMHAASVTSYCVNTTTGEVIRKDGKRE